MAVTNPYYEFTPTFVPNTKARSNEVNIQYQAIQNAFDLLPGVGDALTTDTAIFAPETGTGNAYVVTMPDTRTINQDGDGIRFFATHTNAGATTLAVDGIGAVGLVNWTGTVLGAGAIVSGRIYEVRYDASNSRFVIAMTTDNVLQVAYAEEWATKPEDTLISIAAGGDGATDYSALHWAAKSLASAGASRVNTDIITSTPPTTEGVTGNFEIWDLDDTDLLTSIGYLGTNALNVYNRMRGGEVTLRAESTLGANTPIFTASANTASFLYHAGSQRMYTRTDGIALPADIPTATPPTTEAVTISYKLFDLNQNDELAVFGFIGESQLSITNRMHGGGITLDAEDASGVLISHFSVGDVQNAVVQLSGGNFNFTITDLFNTAIVSAAQAGPEIEINAPNGAGTMTLIGYQGTRDLWIENFIHGGGIWMAGQDTGGVERRVIRAFPDSDVELYYAGVQTAGTLTAAAGGFQVNNTLTGAGLERVLTTSDKSSSVDFYNYAFDNSIAMADPGTGDVRFNNATVANITSLAFSNIDSDGRDLSTDIFPNITAGDTLRVVDSDNLAIDIQFSINNTAVGTGWYRLDVTYISGSTLPANTDTLEIEISPRPWLNTSVSLGSMIAWDNVTDQFVSYGNRGTLTNPAVGETRINTSDSILRLDSQSRIQMNQILYTSFISTNDALVLGADAGHYSIGTGGTSNKYLDLWADAGGQPVRIKSGSTLMIQERAAALPDIVAFGQFWVRNDAPNTAMFTGDTGVDQVLNTTNTPNVINADINTATPPVAELVTAELIFRDLANDDDLATFGFGGTNVLQINNLMHGGAVLLQAQDAAGVGRTILSADPDALTTLRADTNLELQVAAGETALLATANAGTALYYNNIIAMQTVDRTASDRASGGQVLDVGGTMRDIGFNTLPRVTVTGGNHTLAKADQGFVIFYDEATARSLLINNDATIPVDAYFAYTVGPTAGVFTGNGGTGVTITFWNGASWTTTSSGASMTIGVGSGTIWKQSDTNFYISGPNLS